jgi:DNA (cytosine-5)-methyltransferase 1
MNSYSTFTFIDLFCGIGGFHQALSNLGGECVFASDIDKECRNVYYANYGLMPNGDITKVIESDIPSFDVLCAGFPCQSFSKAGNRLGIEDARGTLFFDILRIAKYHKPKYMILENVRNLASHDNGNTWKTIHQNLIDIGYHVDKEPIIFSPHFIGIPQHRERVYILCKRRDLGDIESFEYLRNDKKECTIDTILHNDEVTDINNYKLSKELTDLIDIWDVFIKNIKSPLPGFPVWSDRLSELNPEEDLDRHPKWKRDFIIKNHKLYNENREFIDFWLLKANELDNFTGSKAMLEWQVGQIEEPSLWDYILQLRPSGIRVKKSTYFPALVAITQTSIVGNRKRYLTPRECARLQSFSEDFMIHPKDSIAYKQFGNSVNVRVVQMFADFLLRNHTFNPQNYCLDDKLNSSQYAFFSV